MSFVNNGNNNLNFRGAVSGTVQPQQQFNQQPVYGVPQPGAIQQAAPVFNQAPMMQQAAPVFQVPGMQQPTQPIFNLLGPVNQQALDRSISEAIIAILMSVKNDIDRIIVKLVTEHQSGRENIDAIFSSVNLRGVGLDILYKAGQSMCPSFSVYKQVRSGNAPGMSNFGAGLGNGLTINGVTSNIAVNEYTEDPNSKKMNVIVDAFLNIVNMVSALPLNDKFEVRSPAGNINYIPSTGMLILTPSTLILNDHKNDARKLSSRL